MADKRRLSYYQLQANDSTLQFDNTLYSNLRDFCNLAPFDNTFILKWQIKGGCQITKLPSIALMIGHQASSIDEEGTGSQKGYQLQSDE